MGHLFSSSRGRINRRTLWQGTFLSASVIVAYWVVWYIFARSLIVTTDMSENAYANLELVGDILYIPVAVLVAVMTLNVFAKRWHDLGKAALWWNILALIPVVNLVVLLALGLVPGKAVENQWGPVPEARVAPDPALDQFIAWGGATLCAWVVALPLMGYAYLRAYAGFEQGWSAGTTAILSLLGVLALASWVASAYLSKRAVSFFAQEQTKTQI